MISPLAQLVRLVGIADDDMAGEIHRTWCFSLVGDIALGGAIRLTTTECGNLIAGVGQLSCSACTENCTRVFGPKVVLIATSAASRPRAINTRPMRGTLLRGSNVCQAPPR